jgi:hypothetical protein
MEISSTIMAIRPNEAFGDKNKTIFEKEAISELGISLFCMNNPKRYNLLDFYVYLPINP